MDDTVHFQLHPDYTNDEGHYYAVDTGGSFYLLDRSVLAEDRFDSRTLSDGMVVLEIASEESFDAAVRSDDLAPDEVPMDVPGV